MNRSKIGQGKFLWVLSFVEKKVPWGVGRSAHKQRFREYGGLDKKTGG
jgi:hypothetical protein